MRRLLTSLLFLVPLSGFGLSSVLYDINSLAENAQSQSPSLPSNVLGTIVADPADLESNFSSIFGTGLLGAKPDFSVGWVAESLGALVWTAADVRDENEVFAFAVKAASGYTLDINNLSFRWGSTQDGPRKLDITMDIGNQGNTLATLIGDNLDLSTDVATGNGNNIAGTNISVPITMDPTTSIVIFRVYGYDAGPGVGNNSGGFWDETGGNPISLDMVVVPEPSWFALGAGVLAVLVCLRRRV